MKLDQLIALCAIIILLWLCAIANSAGEGGVVAVGVVALILILLAAFAPTPQKVIVIDFSREPEPGPADDRGARPAEEPVDTREAAEDAMTEGGLEAEPVVAPIEVTVGDETVVVIDGSDAPTEEVRIEADDPFPPPVELTEEERRIQEEDDAAQAAGT